MKCVLFYSLTVSFLVSYAFGEVIEYQDCTDTDPKGLCQINEIRITPCKEAAQHKACNLKRGKSSNIQIDIHALQPIETFNALPYLASIRDIPFVGMEKDGCKFTQCPIAQGNNQTYDFQLKLSKSLPRGNFDVKYKFWTNENPDQGCCARFYLKIVS